MSVIIYKADAPFRPCNFRSYEYGIRLALPLSEAKINIGCTLVSAWSINMKVICCLGLGINECYVMVPYLQVTLMIKKSIILKYVDRWIHFLAQPK